MTTDDLFDAATSEDRTPTRRQVFKCVAGLGVGTAVFHRAVAAQAQEAGGVTPR